MSKSPTAGIPPQLEAVARQICSREKWTYTRYLGRGAFKEAYEVRLPGAVPAALKILDSDKENPLRTARELQALQRCKSGRFCCVIEHGEFADRASRKRFKYFLEELMEGGTLTEKLKAGPLPPVKAKEYGRALVEAIGYLKSLKLVHRDIKPDNIMFRKGDDTPVLVDLGLVRDLSETSVTMTWAPRGPGTPYYSSPEQLNNEKHLIGWHSDQYSLGVVLSVCVFGKHPLEFAPPPSGSVVDAVATRQPVPDAYRQALAGLGLELLARMVEPWPIRRYQTIDEVAIALS